MSTNLWKKRIFRIICLCLLSFSINQAAVAVVAKSPVYPAQAIDLICPWAEGGGSDRVARQLAQCLEAELKQPVKVVNRAGGGGVVGHMAGATAEPDGYTLLMLTTEIAMMHWTGLTVLDYRSFIPIALINFDPAAILVREDSKWDKLEELIKTVKAKPGQLHASGTAKGGIWDICMTGWLIASGLKENAIQWVASYGAEPALRKLTTGQVEIVICSLPEADSLIKAGKVRALAVMNGKRDTRYPEVPTLQEKGYSFANGAFRGIAVPIGTSPEI
ncbi:MAG TPA: tripartite tricarboxylate transporter substrate binding protein, partial [Bacillota bacterium]|nr:tripartite tricarboxylate transporter substrate binding protein [Bacillota bacterium]